MDMKTTFLHGILQEEVYIKQPQGFEVEDKKTHVFMLKKVSYGLKQAPKSWYNLIDSYLVNFGFTRSNSDPNIYFKVFQGMPLILVLYVENLFLTGSESSMIECKMELASKFKMKDLGFMHYFLGLKVWQRLNEIFISQGKYVLKLLERFGMIECKSLPRPMEMSFKKLCEQATTCDLENPSKYRKLIGVMIFLVNTHLYICYAVNTLSQFMTEPLHAH